MAKKETQQLNVAGRWTVVIVVVLILAIVSFISAFIIGIFVATSETGAAGNVAHIKITGPIMSEDPGGFMSGGVASSTELVRLIDEAAENPEVVAILFEVNSPGGTAVASNEIADAILRVNKTTVAWMREVAASGGYWAASACDHVVANPMTITGSIGVIGSYIEWGGTLERYNASYRRLVSGEFKDIGSPFKEMTPDEEEIMQDVLGMMRSMFVSAVADNRGLEYDAVDAVADGRFYIGKQALELGLVDQLGGKEQAIAWIEDKEDIEAELAVYEAPKTLAEVLAGVFGENSFYVGQGIGKAFLDANVGQRVEVFT